MNIHTMIGCSLLAAKERADKLCNDWYGPVKMKVSKTKLKKSRSKNKVARKSRKKNK